MVLNPRAKHRRGKKGTRKMAKRRRMSALQRKYFGKGHKSHHRRRSGGRKPRVVVVASNPRRNPKRRRRMRNPRTIAVHRRRMRNPISSGGFFTEALTFGALAAGGAYATQWLQARLPIPASMQQSATTQSMVTAGLALALGLGVDMVMGADAGAAAAAGGLVVAFSSMLSGMGTQQGYGQQGYGMNRYMHRYMGFLKATPRQRVMINQRRMLRGLPPIKLGPRMPVRVGRMGARPWGLQPVRMRQSPLGATTPYTQTKFRILRGGHSGGTIQQPTRLGYIGPARTLGRYMTGAHR